MSARAEMDERRRTEERREKRAGEGDEEGGEPPMPGREGDGAGDGLPTEAETLLLLLLLSSGFWFSSCCNMVARALGDRCEDAVAKDADDAVEQADPGVCSAPNMLVLVP